MEKCRSSKAYQQNIAGQNLRRLFQKPALSRIEMTEQEKRQDLQRNEGEPDQGSRQHGGGVETETPARLLQPVAIPGNKPLRRPFQLRLEFSRSLVAVRPVALQGMQHYFFGL